MAEITSILDMGFDGVPVTVQCQLSRNLPSIVIVGMATKTVEESKERIRGAFSACNLKLPKGRITINLAPADIPKNSSSFDLAIAVAILYKGKIISDLHLKTGQAFIGELGLDGSLQPVRGIVGKLLIGKKLGIKSFFIPADNLAQASLVPSIKLVAVKTLAELYQILSNKQSLPTITTDKLPPTRQSLTENFELAIDNVVGQAGAKRALEIAAAGGHNLVLNGPPGTGKSMLAKALPSILPPLTREESLEVTHLHSLAGRDYDKVIDTRPFRSPHHTASHVSIVGGGANLRPGEISLSHRGVMFLDEIPEFDRSTIEALRQPLEDKNIVIARAKDSVTYPANFILVATANPCPCGYYGTNKTCRCLPHQIMRYQRKLSGPIWDRIDLYSDVYEVEHRKLLTPTSDNKVAKQMRTRVINARKLQAGRYGGSHKLNASMTNSDIHAFSKLSRDAEALLNTAAERLDLSARAYMRSVKVARTIADLADSSEILAEHLSEALQFRPKTLSFDF